MDVKSRPPCYSEDAHPTSEHKEALMSLAPPASPSFASRALDPIPFVQGLTQLVPLRRLAAILTRTGRGSERRRSLPAEAVIWLVIAMTLFAADSIPKVWRRL